MFLQGDRKVKMKKAESDKSAELSNIMRINFSIRKQLNDYLRKENTKIQEVVVCDDMFVETLII